MKRVFSIMARKADGANVVESVSTPGTGSMTDEKRDAEDAVQGAYSGSEILSGNFTGVIDREI